jgi:hypothetical protein
MTPAGLSAEEVQQRRDHGLGNGVAPSTGRSYLAIARANLFT